MRYILLLCYQLSVLFRIKDRTVTFFKNNYINRNMLHETVFRTLKYSYSFLEPLPLPVEPCPERRSEQCPEQERRLEHDDKEPRAVPHTLTDLSHVLEQAILQPWGKSEGRRAGGKAAGI